ncbi:sugar phosphate isomerase/epimerase [candidate division KSB1 bacterium]|nr:sugar phosphate isomerase/epimerase [candidate division KSB1 bacterium]
MKDLPLGLFIIPDTGLEMRLNTAKSLNITTAHVLTPPRNERTSDKIQLLMDKFNEANVEITILFCGFEGESYASIAEVEKTVGLAPEPTCHARLQECKEISDFARALDVKILGMHLGFIPEDTNSETYRRLLKQTRELCDYCHNNEQRLHLETGQEKAEVLLGFIHDVDRVNLAINFDPANMILYGAGEPISALRFLGHYVKSVHCKDAKWADNPGQDWGTEVVAGQGDVNFEAFFMTLEELGYRAPLTIEREISGDKQIKDIENTVLFLNNIRNIL